jgi:hypothetical protein
MRLTPGVGPALAISILAVACATPPAAQQPATATAPAVECVPPPGAVAVAPESAQDVDEARRAAESGPLYAALAERSAVASCQVRVDSGQVTLEYTFAGGGALTFERNPTIEYSNQEVRVTGLSAGNAVELLQRVERSSFAPDGCGIDWADAVPVESAPPDITETAYYGDPCNCQARVRTDAAGNVIGLVFRSAC